jgi:hypothetical protein
MFTTDEIKEVSSLTGDDLRYKQVCQKVNNFYHWIKEVWTTKAIKEFKEFNQELDLRKPYDRLNFAILAAQQMVKDFDPIPELEPVKTNPNPLLEDPKINPEINPSTEFNTVRFLARAIALLNPVPPTNNLENTPGYKILGSPIYLDELVRNYRVLAKKFHPDINHSLEASDRLALVNQIYSCLVKEWFTKYSPLIPIEKLGKENLDRAMSKQYNFTPESFWS